MITRSWNLNNAKLEDTFFPVELCDLKFVYPEGRDLFGQATRTIDIPVAEYKAVVDMERRQALSTVSSQYRLVTNQEAYEWAAPVVKEVFNASQLSDFTCFNVYMSASRANCRIDLVRKGGNDGIPFRFFGEKDPWVAFIRIMNSYNKTWCLRYELGFCRWICKNGMIFGSKSVDYIYPHTKVMIDDAAIRKELSVAAREQIGEIRSIEAEFMQKLNVLRNHNLPYNCVLALACKVFNKEMTRESSLKLSGKSLENAKVFATTIRSLAKDYCAQMGNNAYAALNVLTDYASYPKGMDNAGSVSRLQERAGAWVDQFIAASSEHDFNLTKYLGDEAMESAIWFDSLLVA